MKIKRIAAIVAGATLTVSMVGCGSTSSNASTVAESPGSDEAEATTGSAVKASAEESTLDSAEYNVDEPATLKVLFCQGPSEAGLEDQIDEEVQALYPNISCEYEIITWEDLPGKLQQYMQSGMPDIVIAKSQDANNFGKYGIWADLSEKDYIHNVYDSAMYGVTIDGQVLGMPYIGSYGGVYYNKKMFEQYGLEIPKTEEDLEHVCKTLKDNGITPFATHFLDTWFHGWEMAIACGGELMSASETWGDDFHDGKVNCESDEFQNGLNLMQLIHDNTFDDCYSVEQSTCDARFVQGEAAMQFDMSGVAATYMELDPELDFGIFPFPTTKGDGCLNMEPNATFFKSASTKHDEACDAFLSVMASPEAAGAWSQYVGEASLIQGAESFESPVTEDIQEYANQGLTRDQNKITNQLPYNEFWDPLQSDFTEYINGNMTLEEVTKNADGRADVCGTSND